MFRQSVGAIEMEERVRGSAAKINNRDTPIER